MIYKVEIEREDDGRWIAEIVDIPGVIAYGATPEAAQARVRQLATAVLAERRERGEAIPEEILIVA